jgi:predicted short-subunit dehydrogenase-like oxidoreductase (DUF2520 family)
VSARDALRLWQVVEDDDQDEVLHVLPLVDARTHVATVRCLCGPTLQAQAHGSMYVHNSLAEPQQIH